MTIQSKIIADWICKQHIFKTKGGVEHMKTTSYLSCVSDRKAAPQSKTSVFPLKGYSEVLLALWRSSALSFHYYRDIKPQLLLLCISHLLIGFLWTFTAHMKTWGTKWECNIANAAAPNSPHWIPRGSSAICSSAATSSRYTCYSKGGAG